MTTRNWRYSYDWYEDRLPVPFSWSLLYHYVSGADRVELCSALSEGGLTPSVGMIKVVRRAVHLPIMVMIRPRGGDFLYSSHEVEIMLADIEQIKTLGVDGFVFGALTSDGEVDVPLMRRLVSACDGLPVTFHRGLHDRMTKSLLFDSTYLCTWDCTPLHAPHSLSRYSW
jgi:copper homeostasis protein CutC